MLIHQNDVVWCIHSWIRFWSSPGSSPSFLHEMSFLLPFSNSEQLPCFDFNETVLLMAYLAAET